MRGDDPVGVGAEDAAVSRVVPGERCLEDISRHGWSQPARATARRLPRHRVGAAHATAGQVVVGDPASDPAEVALLERQRLRRVLMVPLVFGGRDVGLLELYRATRCRGAARRSSARSCSRTSSRDGGRPARAVSLAAD